MGADISHGRALDECMDDNWGGARPAHEGRQLPPAPPPSMFISFPGNGSHHSLR